MIELQQVPETKKTAKTKNVQSAVFFFFFGRFFFGGEMNVSALVVGSCLVKGFSWKTRWSVQPNVNVVGGGSSLHAHDITSLPFFCMNGKKDTFTGNQLKFYFWFSTSNFTWSPFFFPKKATFFSGSICSGFFGDRGGWFTSQGEDLVVGSTTPWSCA